MFKYFFTLFALLACLATYGKGHTYTHAITFGSTKAPVTMIELVAPTCHVCSEFSQTLVPKLIDHYVKTGKVRLVILTLPYNYIDLKASALMLGGTDAQKMYQYIFKEQEKWLFKKDPLAALNQVLQKKGISAQELKKRGKNEKLENFLIKQRMDLEEAYDIDAIPLSIIGQRKIIGLIPWKDLKKHIDEALIFVKKGNRLEDFGKEHVKQSKNKRKKRRD